MRRWWNVMDDGSPHNWTRRSDGQKFISVASLSRNCTDITHANYFGLFSMQRHDDDDDDDPLLSSVCADFIRNSKIISDRSYIRQVSLMLLMRPQKQAGRSRRSLSFCFCHDYILFRPCCSEWEEDQTSATEYEFYICNAAGRSLCVTASPVLTPDLNLPAKSDILLQYRTTLSNGCVLCYL